MKRRLPRKFEIARAASFLSRARTARKVGAALFSGSILLSVGNNEYGHTHPNSKPYCNLHAEHRCLLRRRYYKDGSNLCIYIYRETVDGSLGCSRPCANCISLLREAGVKKAYYFNVSGNIESLKIS